MRFVGLAIIMAASAFAAEPAGACSCDLMPDVQTAFDEADAVFTGEVVALHVLVETGGQKNAEHLKYGETLRASVLVSAKFKGDIGSMVLLETGRDSGSCGYGFRVGERYLIYSYFYDREPHRPLTTGICTRTVPLHEGTSDLIQLSKLDR